MRRETSPKASHRGEEEKDSSAADVFIQPPACGGGTGGDGEWNCLGR